MVFDFYAYWNAEALSDLFNAIVGMMGTSDYTRLMMSLILIGFLVTLTLAALLARGRDTITWFGAVVLLYFVLFVPKVTLVIHDVRTEAVKTVDNVPFGVGFIAATSSQIGHWATELFETAMNDTEAEKFSRFGVVFPQRAVSALLTAGPLSTEAKTSLDTFVSSCIAPEVLDNPAKLTALMSSASLIGTLQADAWLNPARFVAFDDGRVLSCTDALEAIDETLNRVEIPLQKKVLGIDLGLFSSSDILEARIEEALPQAEHLMLGTSRDLTESLKQSVLIQSLPKGLTHFASQSGAPLATAVTIAKAQGNLASEINYRTMSEIARTALPKLRNTLEFIVIAIFPLLFLLMFVAGAKAGFVLRSYLTLLVWVQLWAPITAVINYLLIHVDREPMNQLVNLYGGVTLESATLIREMGASSQAMAGALMLLVPVIAWVIAKGSDIAAANLAASVLSPAQSAAQASGSSLATGNIQAGNTQLGNTTFNNTSANKWDRSIATSSPDMEKNTDAYGSYVRDTNTQAVTGIDATKINMGVSSTSSTNASSSTSTGTSDDTRLSTSKETGLQTSQSSTSQSATLAQHQEGTSLQENRTQGESHATSNQQLQSTSQAHQSAIDQSRTSAMSESFGVGSRGGVGNKSALIRSNDTGDTSQASLPSIGLNLNQAPLTSGMNLKPTTRGLPTHQERDDVNFINKDFGIGINTSTQGSHVDQSRVSAQDTKAASLQHTTGQLSQHTQGFNAQESESEAFQSNTSQGHITGSQAQGHTGETDRLDQVKSAQETQRTDQSNANGVSVDYGPALIAKSMNTYGSPEVAARALYNTQERQQFGEHQSQDVQTPTMNSEKIKEDLNQQYKGNQAQNLAQQNQLIRENAQNAKGQVTAFEQQGENAIVAQKQGSHTTPEAQETQGNLSLFMGSALVANHLYETKEISGLNTLGVAALGGHYYNSPAELRERLLTKSKEDPQVENLLKTIGEKSESITPKELDNALKSFHYKK